DLVNWQHLPIALYPDEHGTIFSGSAVVDWHNTAGLGREALVAIFTHHSESAWQSQSLAYSTDKGRTWTKYAGNPVLEPPNNIRNFRDPKVFWYGDAETGHWVMAVTGGNVILFFSSHDLKTWEPTGGFGFGYGSTEGIWETPDLFPLPVDGRQDTRWVLTVGVGNGGPVGGTGTQYFVGHFDGENFTSENPKNIILWADFGADFYAAQSWSYEPDGRRFWIGWMNNWRYADRIPTTTWRGAFTLPRELSLRNTPDGIRLVQTPIPALRTLRGDHQSWQNQTTSSHTQYPISNTPFELLAEIPILPNMNADRLGLRIHTDGDHQTTIGYTTKSHTLFIDRSQCGATEFSPAFSGVHLAKLEPENGVIRLHIFVDSASVEVFGNNGQVVITDQIFPCGENTYLEIFADGGAIILSSFDMYILHPANYWLPSVHDK
ncbi:MAG TPA: glycoside hydrolase family 32 protein, partial [Anaerolineales bacterium]|nr:glycoside hydrolase family 32 protein [Anaerolineales bacterium]